MKRFFAPLATFAGMLVAFASINPAHAQAPTGEGPANPPVYACVDTAALGGGQTVRWVTAAGLPCTPPLLNISSVEGQPSQTIFTAAFNADGSLAGESALSGNAADNSSDGVYTINFTSAFSAAPNCQAAIVGASETDYQIEVSNVTSTGATVEIQYNATPYYSAQQAFVLSCSNPQ